jgi:hypothetical protein
MDDSTFLTAVLNVICALNWAQLRAWHASRRLWYKENEFDLCMTWYMLAVMAVGCDVHLLSRWVRRQRAERASCARAELRKRASAACAELRKRASAACAELRKRASAACAELRSQGYPPSYPNLSDPYELTYVVLRDPAEVAVFQMSGYMSPAMRRARAHAASR